MENIQRRRREYGREKTKEILTKINIDVFFGIMFMSNEITPSVYL
jgi:hypothetical protein